MAEAKTQITDVDPNEFIASVEPAVRRDDADVLDAMFRRVTGEEPRMWGATMVGYGQYRVTYATGRDVHWLRTGFSPRKAKHSLYILGCSDEGALDKRRDEQLARLGKHSRGVSCLYINKLADIDLAVLEEMIAEDWAVSARYYPEDQE